jgi:hypothetical protein
MLALGLVAVACADLSSLQGNGGVDAALEDAQKNDATTSFDSGAQDSANGSKDAGKEAAVERCAGAFVAQTLSAARATTGMCNGTMVSLEGPEHCGSCDQTCPAAAACVGGFCQAPTLGKYQNQSLRGLALGNAAWVLAPSKTSYAFTGVNFEKWESGAQLSLGSIEEAAFIKDGGPDAPAGASYWATDSRIAYVGSPEQGILVDISAAPRVIRAMPGIYDSAAISDDYVFLGAGDVSLYDRLGEPTSLKFPGGECIAAVKKHAAWSGPGGIYRFDPSTQSAGAIKFTNPVQDVAMDEDATYVTTYAEGTFEVSRVRHDGATVERIFTLKDIVPMIVGNPNSWTRLSVSQSHIFLWIRTNTNDVGELTVFRVSKCSGAAKALGRAEFINSIGGFYAVGELLYASPWLQGSVLQFSP